MNAATRILLTGGGGFFGLNAIAVFDSLGYTVVPASRNPEQYAAYAPSLSFVELDINVPESLSKAAAQVRPDIIVHAAAYASPGLCEQNPVRAQEVNAGGAAKVFSIAVALDIPFIFLSTDLVFNGARGYYSELDVPEPVVRYGATKLTTERMLAEQRLFDKWAVLRCSLMFGLPTPWNEGFPYFALNALKRGEQPTLFYDQYRSPVYCADVARAVDAVVRGELYREVFNIGGPERLNRVQFVERYCRRAGIDFSRIHKASMNDMPAYTTRVADVSLTANKLTDCSAWQPTALDVAFDEMIERVEATAFSV